MPAEQRQFVFMLAIGVTVIFVIVGILYLAGAVIATGAHNKRALVCFVVAVVAAIVAYFTRPQAQVAR